MTGRFIAIVGPSGVGKDSVMDALARVDARFTLARRVISRPVEKGGEVYDGVTEKAFAIAEQEGAFVLSWAAHGLHYGIPKTIMFDLAQGRDVLVNLSRAILPRAQTLFDRFCVILLSADQDVLAARLTARNREDPAEIARRLHRADFAMPTGVPYHRVDNSGPLVHTVEQVGRYLSGSGFRPELPNQKNVL
ncbi:MAG: phosphonate metabolism protein/1,5-bisphosphokinase (PRPP-forming) PhnN [Sulfitobacter sp.]|jgi:ribose 1,5-bisphosphokinase|uniref:phosphonate metabolism protein/1,5-bisphosphokinase (PRPP-forming) PhnN n=1 Tax=Sulfitobacter sp. TaxID=1903071 RepID=UPI003B5EF16D|tara:strand:- start:11865 stop:12440 length:576 start_codon:yes stop_codon:yes gene_type:complete